MGLIKLTDRVYYYPYESETDRPNLGYIRGDNYSVAVDAGHSANNDFLKSHISIPLFP